MKINDLLNLKSSYNMVEKKIILSFLLNCSKLDLILITTDIDLKIVNKYKKMIKSDLPIQYLIKKANFLGYDFFVNKDVLIPRFETEELVSFTNDLIKKHFKDNISICDIGTGSGVIAISLKKLNKYYDVDAVDISKKALKVAKYNATLLNTSINFIHGNMLDELDKKYNCLISNPPYLYENTNNIEDKVLKYEPHIALFGGLKYYEEILSKAKNYLKEKSIIAFEIGYEEKEDINKIVKKYFPNSIIINKKDLNNFDRYIYILNNIE